MIEPAKVPSPEQLAAADRIYGLAVEWQQIDRALYLLAERVGGYSSEAVLLKATAINSLYSTNVYAIVRVAEFMAGVLSKEALDEAGPELVEKLANVPKGGSEKKARRRHSFASKFAHFFINPNRFPILDRFTEEMVRRHLGGGATGEDQGRYVTFARGIDRLRAMVVPHPSNADLDHYLLIAGQYYEWMAKDENAAIGSEMKAIFRKGGEDLRRLLPEP